MTSERTCPVCGYNELRRPPTHSLICPSCGTEFDVDDVLYGIEVLRERWKSSGPAGPQWFSRITPPPPGWDWRAQLERVEVRLFGSNAGGVLEVSRRPWLVDVEERPPSAERPPLEVAFHAAA